jgi:hypothetical protein
MTIFLQTGGALLLLAGMVPGAGAKLFLTHVRNWTDPNYNAPLFARQLMERIPRDAMCTVDHEYLLDFLVSGRPVLGIPTSRIYLNAEDYPYDYLIVSRYGLRTGVPDEYGSRRVASAGLAGDELACYAEIHVPAGTGRSGNIAGVSLQRGQSPPDESAAFGVRAKTSQ